MSDSGSHDGTGGPDDVTLTMGGGGEGSLAKGTLAPGQVLGERYELWSLLGRGGMGVVWHAFDLKLRVEVALKALRKDPAGGTRAVAVVRREVRAAREVVSPNVCRIFDLADVDGQELISMEYVDGDTLREVLLEDYPTAALAFARASLGITDTAEARRFALEALWRGGAARIVPAEVVECYFWDFSPDGRWLAGTVGGQVVLIASDGAIEVVFDGLPGAWESRRVAFDQHSTTLITGAPEDPVSRFWSLAEQWAVRALPVGEAGFPFWLFRETTDHVVTSSSDGTLLRAWPLEGGEPVALPQPPIADMVKFGASGYLRYPSCQADLVRRRFLCARGPELVVRDFDPGAPELLVGRHEPRVLYMCSPTTGDRIVSQDVQRQDIRVWTTAGARPRLERVLRPPAATRSTPGISHDGRRVVVGSSEGRAVYMWDLEGPPEAQPAQRSQHNVFYFLWPPAFHPDGRWLMGSSGRELTLWPLTGREPYLFHAHFPYPC